VTEPAASQPIVAFDFDGTLTVRDSFNAFLRWRVPTGRFALGLLRLAPALISYAYNRDRGRLKAAAVKEFLAGRTPDEVTAEAASFADSVWGRFLRPDALATWNDWKAKGARMVVVTASPAITVEPFARRLGADVLLGTRLKLDGEGRIAGPLAGENCRAGEKVARLRERFGGDVMLAAAYGDTSGDTEMLGIAEVKGFRVFTGRP
jgi:phosphatidylglycerophosphatase C